MICLFFPHGEIHYLGNHREYFVHLFGGVPGKDIKVMEITVMGPPLELHPQVESQEQEEQEVPGFRCSVSCLIPLSQF